MINLIKMKTMKKKKQPETIVAVDIGNTAVSFGVWGNGRFMRTGFLNGQTFGRNVFSKQFKHLPDATVFVICSVVPKATRQFLSLVKACLPSAKTYVVGQNLKVRMPVRYDKRKLGLDRLVNGYGAARLYSLPALVVDFGTAITFDYVSKKGVFEGGTIVPGIGTSLDALLTRAALIPTNARLKPACSLVGHDTSSALSSGVLNGFGALADGLIKRFQAYFGTRPAVVATGGHARLIVPYAKLIRHVDPLHTLKSLVLIFFERRTRLNT